MFKLYRKEAEELCYHAQVATIGMTAKMLGISARASRHRSGTLQRLVVNATTASWGEITKVNGF